MMSPLPRERTVGCAATMDGLIPRADISIVLTSYYVDSCMREVRFTAAG